MPPNALRDMRRFASSFLRDPAGVSSIIPTSRFAIRRICDKIDGSARRVIVEYGPGTGGVARALLQPGRLTADSTLILIERDKRLAAGLRDTFDDPRVRVFHDDAARVRDILHACGEEKADYVLLSIPLAWMTADARASILEHTKNILKDDGKLIVFLVHPSTPSYIRAHFPDLRVQWEPRNLPPLILMEASR